MTRPFKSELVLEERISDSTLRAYHVGFDQNKFRLKPLVDVIRSVIPEFAFGFNPSSVHMTDLVEILAESARKVYLTDNYKRRGEFGELILHLLLRDFHNSIPLVSKIYFKDSHNNTVKGFDGVHITVEPTAKKLWLGESKLYSDGIQGVKSLANDLKHHIEADYLRKEFELLSRKIPDNVPEINYWRDLMNKNQKLENILDAICIPMVCTYSSSIFTKHNKETTQYLLDFEQECRNLEVEFNNKKIATNVEVLLMLLPVPDKDQLNHELDTRLKHMQEI